MNSSALVLLGAFDALIALIQNERETLCKSFEPDAAVQTLKKIKSEYLAQLLASTRAELHAADAFRATIDQLLAGLPQGCDLEPVVRSLHQTIATFLPQGPIPPLPSRSSSKSPLGLELPGDLSKLITQLQGIVEQKIPR